MDEVFFKKVPFYKNNKLLVKFIFLYIFIFLFYGYLFLGGAIIFGLIFINIFYKASGFLKYIQFLWLIPSGYCFIRFIVVISTTKYRWRLYRIAYYRLNTRGYSEDYFKYDIYEACTRLIVKHILYEFGFKNEYSVLKRKYLKVNQRIEDQKVRILSDVIRRDKENQLQEVSNG